MWIIENTDPGNGFGVANTWRADNLICMNTFPRQKNTHTPNLATWHNHVGAVSRKIDFVLINYRYRN